VKLVQTTFKYVNSSYLKCQTSFNTFKINNSSIVYKLDSVFCSCVFVSYLNLHIRYLITVLFSKK
jgi:hypothetical protein